MTKIALQASTLVLVVRNPLDQYLAYCGEINYEALGSAPPASQRKAKKVGAKADMCKTPSARSFDDWLVKQWLPYVLLSNSKALAETPKYVIKYEDLQDNPGQVIQDFLTATGVAQSLGLTSQKFNTTFGKKFFEGGRLEERGQGMIKLDEMNIVPTAVLGSRYENTLNQLGYYYFSTSAGEPMQNLLQQEAVEAAEYEQRLAQALTKHVPVREARVSKEPMHAVWFALGSSMIMGAAAGVGWHRRQILGLDKRRLIADSAPGMCTGAREGQGDFPSFEKTAPVHGSYPSCVETSLACLSELIRHSSDTCRACCGKGDENVGTPVGDKSQFTRSLKARLANINMQILSENQV
mmetsp:Transcript_33673/g.63401  ORF Transcript_33673/g.63401 Transcript_33673/m.63401 type:complete len:352 (+) Transcript_33673:36-1091(+)